MKLFIPEREVQRAEEEMRIDDTVRAFRKWLKRRKLTRDGKPISDADSRDLGIMIALSYTEEDSSCAHCEVQQATSVIWNKMIDEAKGHRLNN